MKLEKKNRLVFLMKVCENLGELWLDFFVASLSIPFPINMLPLQKTRIQLGGCLRESGRPSSIQRGTPRWDLKMFILGNHHLCCPS